MSVKISRSLLLLSLLAIVPGPAGAQTGNGPPAVTLTPGDGRNQPPKLTKEELKQAASERPLGGLVTDADGKPVVGAVVQLKNMRTLQIRSFITREKGDYLFTGLNKDVDFEVKAEFKGHASAPRTLSSFDTKPQPTLNLQIK